MDDLNEMKEQLITFYTEKESTVLPEMSRKFNETAKEAIEKLFPKI
jgi:hypothetical protein